ncbi:MAG: M17 family peptidase N-terminal domain-containing protein, partial [Ilumatobacteraceae bacterium]
MTAAVQIVRSVPRTADAVGVPVATSGAVPRSLGLGRSALAAHGFEGKVGQTLVVPSAEGATMIAVGIGAPGTIDAKGLRNAAAALVRAAGKRGVVATSLTDIDAAVKADVAAQAVTEGALLAGYRYAGIKKEPNKAGLTELLLVVGEARRKAVTAGVERGVVTATAAFLARDLANTPPAHMTAKNIADIAVSVAAESGLEVEVFNKDQLEAMGCGGMIGVNRGSTEPPRMVR